MLSKQKIFAASLNNRVANMTALSLLQQEYFAPTDDRVAPEDFFVLAAHCTGREKTFLLAHPEYLLTPEDEQALRTALKRRRTHEPVAHITGRKEFYGREFIVTSNTLIPRPETEHMIEAALNILPVTSPQDLSSFDIVDVGTGSGNIILTLALECEMISPKSTPRYVAIDISKNALDVARINAKLLEKKSRVQFLQSDLFTQFRLPHTENRRLLVVANLPYLSTALWQASMTDVQSFEPKGALESGPDGLNHYRRLLEALVHLRKQYASIHFLLEISPEQDRALSYTIRNLFPHVTLDIHADLSGRSRLVQGSF